MKYLYLFFSLLFTTISMLAQNFTGTNLTKSNPAVAVNQTDSLALVALYNTTQGDA